MTKKILVTATNYSQLCAEAKKLLEENGCEIIENTFGRPMTFDELKARVGDIDGVIAGVDAWNDEVFAIAPQLKVISRFGVGVDNIDVEAARRRGIKVTNAAGGNANAVAELTIGLIVGAMRAVPQLHATTRQGAWDRFVGREVVGRTVGLLGFGNIAQKVARKLSGFDVTVIAYDKYPNLEAAAKLGVAMVGADEVIARSDILCMLLPSLPETRRFMNADAFGRMKDGAYFVNTARGALVDEDALAGALTSGKLAGAAIDVYEREPSSVDNPLFRLDRVVTTPHTAAETFETYTGIGAITATAVLDVLAGRTPKNLL
ncbi:3-phosphoglycerate dehydrogenase [uncultured Pleomorphomonas sp.]|uniref:3-phosphoglycerate dehydrogenase n=1 Tax=uncultured Pleomorphomonas sp. TaxID=442121 RepID=A0A212LG25_9HYPH|nr:phosphoglycerate dehydrogenase [uncultured Pleomorphomonas sp.]SCM76514.1 3-phosphoglycerate dehydrogenase [uncultured Pleomorphomonas sp.]